MSNYLFTSESVSEGHPDKVADQISDAILDAIIKEDPASRVACQTFIKTGVAIVGGEITTEAWVDLDEIIRMVIVDIGYDSSGRVDSLNDLTKIVEEYKKFQKNSKQYRGKRVNVLL